LPDLDESVTIEPTMARIRLVALDLDGTLIAVDDHQVHPVVEEAIRRALDREVQVTIATGRSFDFTHAVATGLGLDAPLICHQGTVIRGMDGRMLRNRTLEPEAFTPGLELARARGWQVYLEGRGKLVLEEGRRYSDSLIRIQALPTAWVPDLGQVSWANQFGVYWPGGVRPAYVAELEVAFGAKATVMRTHPDFVNVVAVGVSKGEALSWLAEWLGIPVQAILAVGDSENDISMLTWAGVGVAMGGARREVVEAADWVAPDLAAHGAAAALERFVFGGDDD
jgi:hydroxymethylpyrimidine pyrophosphatase-like HAD family hydrolase